VVSWARQSWLASDPQCHAAGFTEELPWLHPNDTEAMSILVLKATTSIHPALAPICYGKSRGKHRFKDFGREDRAVDQRTFNVVASVIFALVALLHLLRIYMGWPIVIGSWTAPMWVSWIGLVVAGGLSYFGLSLARRS
jgi:hypothetical protein